ncbi:DUF7344 domain-containing protein [Halovivax limisalsi]|uniref:DUF7344 domain-containing protein n=1 Tax=Halovivax limisalsi TaxID=1453760 RepID=UPI001FFCE725|nr:hypothetical protein [Halovivax limisalsi]
MVGTAIEFDAILEACQDQHRRIVLSKLATAPASVPVDELAAAIAEQNPYAPAAAVSEAELTRIEISLVHTHIPKLEALSLVEYDRDRHRVEPTPRFEQSAPELIAIIEADPERPEGPFGREIV